MEEVIVQYIWEIEAFWTKEINQTGAYFRCVLNTFSLMAGPIKNLVQYTGRHLQTTKEVR